MTFYEFASALKEVGLIYATKEGYEVGIKEGFNVHDLLQKAYQALTNEEE